MRWIRRLRGDLFFLQTAGATVGSSIATLVSSVTVVAQSTPPAGVTIPPTVPDTIEQIIPKPSESPRIPAEPPRSLPKPSLQTPPIPRGNPDSSQPPEVPSPPSDRFLVKKVEVLGNTILHQAIADLIKPFQNSEVTFEELIGLRSAITQLYINNGYVTSGAFLLNNQALSSGVVQIQVVEGELEPIRFS